MGVCGGGGEVGGGVQRGKQTELMKVKLSTFTEHSDHDYMKTTQKASMSGKTKGCSCKVCRLLVCLLCNFCIFSNCSFSSKICVIVYCDVLMFSHILISQMR